MASISMIRVLMCSEVNSSLPTTRVRWRLNSLPRLLTRRQNVVNERDSCAIVSVFQNEWSVVVVLVNCVPRLTRVTSDDSH